MEVEFDFKAPPASTPPAAPPSEDSSRQHPSSMATSTPRKKRKTKHHHQPQVQPQQQPLPLSSALEPLASVALVFRRLTGDTSTTASLPHVVDLVSSYVDGALPRRWAMERAVKSGFGLRMLKRLAAHEERHALASRSQPPIDPFYHVFLASKALVAIAKRRDDVVAARWICSDYCVRVVPVNAMLAAAHAGPLRVLQWLSDRYQSVELDGQVVNEAVRGG